MSFSLFKILKGLLISEENTLTPKEIEIVPGGTAGKKTTVVSSQTDNVTITLPDSTDTLATETQVEAVQTNLDTHINDTTGAHAASAISNIPQGNLEATDVQTALNELQDDIVGFAGDLEDHTEATIAHGTTSDIVGKDDSQVLTNKTISGSSNTLSNIASTSTTFATETSLNIGTSNDNSVVNIGTGTGTNTINIGGANSQINLVGDVISQDVENLNVKDKLITLNDGGAAGSGAVSGIEIEEGGSPTGYVATSADRNSWELKAPNAAGIVSVTPGATNDTVTLNAAEQTLSNKTFSDAIKLDGLDATPSLPAAGYYKVYVKDSYGKLALLDSAGNETLIGGEGYEAVAGEALSANDAIYIASTSDTGRTVGRAYKLDPTNPNRIEFAGFAKASANLGDTLLVLTTGELSGFSGLTVGQPVFASVTVPGGHQAAVPSVVGEYIIQIGVASSASTLVINGALSSTATLVESPDMNIGAGVGSSLALGGTLAASAILQADSTSKGFLAPRMTLAERDAIVSPATGLQVYNTSSNKLNVYNGTSWTDVGSGAGGSKNYIPNPDFEAGATTNWLLGSVSLDSTTKFPSGVPSFGSGASANLSINTVTGGSQLSGTYSMSYASSTSTVAGNFVATSAFSIDKEDQAKMLRFSFSYQAAVNPTSANWSGTTSNSFGVAIYDITNSQWIQPSGCFSMVQSSGVGSAYGEFQTSSNGTQYRLIIYNANATSAAITMYFDSISVGPQAKVLGVPVTNWVSYTPTLFGDLNGLTYTNNTTTGRWRRIGDSAELEIYTTFSGLPGTGTGLLSWSLPFSIDTNKIVASVGNFTLGLAQYEDSGTGFYDARVRYRNATSVFVSTKMVSGTIIFEQDNSVTPSVPVTIANNDKIIMRFKVPVAGWSSNTVMSSDAATNVVDFVGYNGNTQALTANTTLLTFTTSKDSSGAWDGDEYIVPVAGDYSVSLNYYAPTSGACAIYVQVNGADPLPVKTYLGVGSASQAGSGTAIVSGLKASDRISLKSDSSVTLSSGARVLSIQRISGPAQIAASSVVGFYRNNSGASTTSVGTSATKITVLNNSVTDTHGGWDALNNVYRVPISGFYKIFGSIRGGAITAVNGDLIVSIGIDGTSFADVGNQRNQSASAQNLIANGTLIKFLNAGQTIELMGRVNSGTSSVGDYNPTYLSIERLGGVM